MKLSMNGKALVRNLSSEWQIVRAAWSTVESVKRAGLVEERYTDTGAVYQTLWLRLNESGLAAQQALGGPRAKKPDVEE